MCILHRLREEKNTKSTTEEVYFSPRRREVPFGHATEDETRFRADDLGLLLGLLLEVAFVRRGEEDAHKGDMFLRLCDFSVILV